MLWHHGPTVPAAGKPMRVREHRAPVEAEWAPAHEAGCLPPGHPRWAPRAAGNPEPAAARKSPAAEMMRRPRPVVHPDPGPAPWLVRSPVAVVIRAPVGRNRGIPDMPVLRRVLPRPVSLERAAVHVQVTGQIRGRHAAAGALVAPS